MDRRQNRLTAHSSQNTALNIAFARGEYAKYTPFRKCSFALSFARLCRQDTLYFSRTLFLHALSLSFIYLFNVISTEARLSFSNVISTEARLSFSNVISTEARLIAREAEKSPAIERAQTLSQMPSFSHCHFARKCRSFFPTVLSPDIKTLCRRGRHFFSGGAALFDKGRRAIDKV